MSDLERLNRAEGALAELEDFFHDLATEAFTAPDATPYQMLDSLKARVKSALGRAEAAEQALMLANQDAEGWRKDAERLAGVLGAVLPYVTAERVDTVSRALAAHDLRVAQ